MQNFKSFGPLGAELQTPPSPRTQTLLPPFYSVTLKICFLISYFSEKEQCGFPSNVPPSNIIGGRKTFPGKYPYTGLVGFKDNDEVKTNSIW